MNWIFGAIGVMFFLVVVAIFLPKGEVRTADSEGRRFYFLQNHELWGVSPHDAEAIEHLVNDDQIVVTEEMAVDAYQAFARAV